MSFDEQLRYSWVARPNLFDRVPSHIESTLKLRLGVAPGDPSTSITDFVCQNSLGKCHG
jgi:hypothetical protein